MQISSFPYPFHHLTAVASRATRNSAALGPLLLKDEWRWPKDSAEKGFFDSRIRNTAEYGGGTGRRY
jgi:hypothetical protein